MPVPEPSPPTYHKVPVPVPVKEPGKARMVWGGEVGGVGWGKVKFLLGGRVRRVVKKLEKTREKWVKVCEKFLRLLSYL